MGYQVIVICLCLCAFSGALVLADTPNYGGGATAVPGGSYPSGLGYSPSPVGGSPSPAAPGTPSFSPPMSSRNATIPGAASVATPTSFVWTASIALFGFLFAGYVQ